MVNIGLQFASSDGEQIWNFHKESNSYNSIVRMMLGPLVIHTSKNIHCTLKLYTVTPVFWERLIPEQLCRGFNFIEVTANNLSRKWCGHPLFDQHLELSLTSPFCEDTCSFCRKIEVMGIQFHHCLLQMLRVWGKARISKTLLKKDFI